MKLLSPANLARKAANLCGRIRGEIRDRLATTYVGRYPPPEAFLNALIGPLDVKRLLPLELVIRTHSEWCLDHEFDILGSGPVRVELSGGGKRSRSTGRNAVESKRIAGLLSASYRRLDWQLDVKSGYRWDGDTWYKSIRTAPAKGVDIKIPWELGRMQHLSALAWAFTLAKAGRPGFRSPSVYLTEFRDQILDFIGGNPPRFGTQWNCAMEAGIRVSNWLVSYDLFRSAGAGFDGEFLGIFLDSVHAHGKHIRENLERYGEERNNHYLANLAGLSFASAYLPSGPETREWKTFASAEVEAEIAYQFNPDGTNFEGSTAYHCFSAEMVAFALAALSRRGAFTSAESPWRIPGECLRKLEGMADFIRAISKENGRIPQIGDNDSGRFLILTPGKCGEDGNHGLEGEELDKRATAATLDGILGRLEVADEDGNGSIEGMVIQHIAGIGATASKARTRTSSDPAGSRETLLEYFENRESGKTRSHAFNFGPRCSSQALHFRAFEAFGLYVYRRDGLFLSVRCGPSDPKGSRGHFHNDQLSLELALDGRDLITDPGSYLYTPLPARRNAYRSVAAHFVPFAFAGIEQESLDDGLFRLGHRSRSECLYAGEDGFLGKCRTGPHEVWRGIRIEENGIILKDIYKGPLNEATLARLEKSWESLPVSSGYGRLSRTMMNKESWLMDKSGKERDAILNRK